MIYRHVDYNLSDTLYCVLYLGMCKHAKGMQAIDFTLTTWHQKLIYLEIGREFEQPNMEVARSS